MRVAARAGKRGQELLPRLDKLALQKGAEVHYHTTFTRSPHSLPITFAPGRRTGLASAEGKT